MKHYDETGELFPRNAAEGETWESLGTYLAMITENSRYDKTQRLLQKGLEAAAAGDIREARRNLYHAVKSSVSVDKCARKRVYAATMNHHLGNMMGANPDWEPYRKAALDEAVQAILDSEGIIA